MSIRSGWLALLLCLPAGAAETMRVQMGPAVATAQIEGEALATGEDAEDARFSPAGAGRHLVARVNGKLTVNGEPVIGDAIRFRAGLLARDAGVPGDRPLKANGMLVRGDVVAVLQPAGVLLVNVLPLEDYLVGVLGSEMPRSFPPEALKAQAVAARTYALQKKLEQYGQPFHLGSSVISQVYGGLKAEDPRTREAVEATRGLVLTYDLQPIEAYFHSSCGGKTESGANALGRDLPYLKPVSCPCGKLPSSQWSMGISSDELKAALGTRPSAMKIEGRTSTGRAKRIHFAPNRSLDAVTFRERLGYTRLKSLQFELEPRGAGWTIHGHGFGHGAGLCQWGAKVLADQGKDFREIVAHYYPGTELQVLY
ncbi:MAG: SpoIID/LytB protein [Myxococcaceae bacterium]|nr:SpoIID/LytB protein [Myxococcaceae bacterium]